MTSWTEHIDLEKKQLAADGCAISFDEWWDQLVGMASRFLQLVEARDEAIMRERQFDPCKAPTPPRSYASVGEYFAFQVAHAKHREGRDQAYKDVIKWDYEIAQLTQRVGGMLLDSAATFQMRIGTDEYLFTLRSSGYNCHELQICRLDTATANGDNGNDF